MLDTCGGVTTESPLFFASSSGMILPARSPPEGSSSPSAHASSSSPRVIASTRSTMATSTPSFAPSAINVVGVAGGFEPEPVVAPRDDALYADILRERPHELFGAHPADRRERHDVLAHGRVAAVHRAVARPPSSTRARSEGATGGTGSSRAPPPCLCRSASGPARPSPPRATPTPRGRGVMASNLPRATTVGRPSAVV